MNSQNNAFQSLNNFIVFRFLAKKYLSSRSVTLRERKVSLIVAAVTSDSAG